MRVVQGLRMLRTSRAKKLPQKHEPMGADTGGSLDQKPKQAKVCCAGPSMTAST